MQHTPINDATRKRTHQFGVGNASEGNSHTLPITKAFR
jgi:hypothetical protein